MNFHNYSTVLFFGFFLLLAPHFLSAQQSESSFAYAGKDTTICRGETVVLGPKIPNPDFCYTWEPVGPAYGLREADRFSSNPEVTPLTTMTYKLTVVGDNFQNKWEDEVKVTVLVPASISALPKDCCWEVGEPISLEQFEINVSPAGLEEYITILPETVPAFQATDELITVTAKVECGEDSIEGPAAISAVNPDFMDPGGGMEFHQIEKLFEKFDKYFEKIDKVVSKLGPCEHDVDVKVDFKEFTGKLCCKETPSDCIRDLVRDELGLIISFTEECDFPFAGIPKLLSVNVLLLLEAELGGVAVQQTDCGDWFENCFEVTGSGSIGGGVSAQAVSKDFLYAKLAVVGGLHLSPINICFVVSPEFEITKFEALGPACPEAKIEGSVTFLSFVEYGVEVPLYKGHCE